MHRETKNILSHASIYLVARGLPGIIAFLAIPLFSRLFGPADYWYYTRVVATVSLLNALMFQWLRLSLVRYLPVFKDDPARLKSTLASTTLLLIFGLGAVAGIIYLLPIEHDWRAVILPCWIVLAVQAMFELACEYSRASLRPWQYMGFQVLRSAAFVGLGVGLVIMGMGWWGPLLGMGAGMALATAWAVGRDWREVKPRIDREAFGRALTYGVPLSITVALTVVISTSDRFLIAWLLGDDPAGLYSVAVDFTAQTLTLIMLVINMAVFPMAVRAWEHDGLAAAQSQMRTNASLLMAVGVPCVIGLALLAPGIAHSFLGKSFRSSAAQIIPLIGLATFLANFKAFHFDASFQFAHRTIYQVWIVLFAAVVNIVLNLIAIPLWGINGSAVASVLAYGVSIALTAGLGRRHFALPFPVRDSVKVLAAGAVMALVLFPWRGQIGSLALVAQIGAGAAIYGCTLVAMDFLGLRQAIKRKLGRVQTSKAAVSEAAVVEPSGLAEAQGR